MSLCTNERGSTGPAPVRCSSDSPVSSEVDGQVFLTDFGSGYYVGAAPLTEPPFPPGTQEYRSPEAWRTVLPSIADPAVPYAPGPADDVFARGVTSYRLVTDEHPPDRVLADETSRLGNQERLGPHPPRVLNGRCCEELSAIISRMVSVLPAVCGSAREVAEAMERAARETGPEADVSLFGREELRSVEVRGAPRRAPGRPSPAWLTAVSLGGARALSAAWLLDEEHASASPPEEAKDGGTVAVGDSVLTAPQSSAEVPSMWSSIALDVPPKPFPGQMRRMPTAAAHAKARLSSMVAAG